MPFPNRQPRRTPEDATSAGGAVSAPPSATAPPAATPPATGVEPWRNPDEIKANFAKVRALEAQVAELVAAAKGQPRPEAPKPGAAPSVEDITAQVTAQVTFNTALQLTAGLSAEQQGILRSLYGIDRPAPDQIGAWMTSKLAALGRAPAAPTGTAPTAATPPAQTSARTDLGAPAIGAAGALPDDPRLIPLDQWKAMDPQARHEITKRWMAKNGGSSNLLKRNRPPAR